MYTYEQIASKDYLKVSGVFLNLCKDDNTLTKMKEILFKGTINGRPLQTGESNKDNPSIEARRRISASYILITNPKTFDYFASNNIDVFHGTKTSALPSIIKYGLTSVDKSRENSVEVNTGEVWSRIGGSRNFVSLTDVPDVAFDYSTIGSQKNELASEALIVTSSDAIKELHKTIVHSDIPEIGIKNELPKKYIKAICVPSDKVSFYQKIVGNDIDILPLDYINDRFYYVDDNNTFYVNDEALKGLENKLSKKQRRFNIKDFVNIFKERLTSKLGKEDINDVKKH